MATPLIPRMHLWEIDDQLWFPSFLRAYVQTGLTHAWTVHVPLLQPYSPATAVANTLCRVLGDRNVSRYTYIDFCAGAGGPTPFIERALNKQLLSHPPASQPQSTAKSTAKSTGTSTETSGPTVRKVPATESTLVGSTNGKKNNDKGEETEGVEKTNGGHNGDNAVRFVLTDLHPHVESWAAAAAKSDHLTYVPQPIDAAAAPTELLQQYLQNANGSGENKKGIFRLFNLAFHHFDDSLARAILKNTVETSDGFGIFELQDRSLAGFLTCLVFGLFIFLVAPLLYWWSPARLFWVYVVPVVPFVLVFDGLVSCLRTRTAAEVEALLRSCGTDTNGWRVRSGREQFLWPCGYLTWIICTKDTPAAQ
ncbi:hypothetical protein AAE478_007676 [Parahypoxylon ruwenzoriense]